MSAAKRAETMQAERQELQFETTAETDLLDLTQEVERLVSRSGIEDGIAFVFVPGSTASITTIEFESGALNDLRRAVEQLAPSDAEYEHNLRWGDGNGYAHVRAALLGPSVAVPVVGGKLALGTWQQIILCDFDNRPRRRRVILQILSN